VCEIRLPSWDNPEGTHAMSQTRNLMRLEILSADEMAQVVGEEEMEKPHIPETKEGESMLWLERFISS
jgi:hypothetical protein